MAVALQLIVDNLCEKSGLQGEHGFSILLAGSDRRFLFDTGSSPETLSHNAGQLDISLEEIDAVILSHGHCDHAGGLTALTNGERTVPLYAHPAAFERRWVNHPGQPLREISSPHTLQALRDEGVVFYPVRDPQKLTDWLVLSGPIGGPSPGGENFIVRQDDELVVDSFEDELFALLRTRDDGWAVLTGCCHRGLKNTLRSAKFLARGEPLRAVIGGLHLRNATPEQIDEVCDLLDSYGRPALYACHCSGENTLRQLKQKMPEYIHPIAAGWKHTF